LIALQLLFTLQADPPAERIDIGDAQPVQPGSSQLKCNAVRQPLPACFTKPAHRVFAKVSALSQRVIAQLLTLSSTAISPP
jgi:hypothetical protein